MGDTSNDEHIPELAVIVSRADGTIVDVNQKARELLGEEGTGACWDVVRRVPGSQSLPCDQGCACRLVAEGHEHLTAKEVMLRGEPHRMTCVPMDGKVITTIVPTKKRAATTGGVKLTRREKQVLVLLAEGLATPEAARRLGVGESTLRTHVENMRTKLQVKTRAALVAKGFALGLLDAG
jgi:DNA-binding CsgD family transcriptional regulator